ncbi:MAG: hypothetical protein AAFW89_12700 [Bacteroidota bacterium]
MRSMKAAFALCTGYIFTILLEGFARIVITFYHRKTLTFRGISDLPGIEWALLILILTGITHWFGAMLSTSIYPVHAHRMLVAFGILVATGKTIELLTLHATEPIWFLGGSMVIALSGVFGAYLIKRNGVTAVSD